MTTTNGGTLRLALRPLQESFFACCAHPSRASIGSGLVETALGSLTLSCFCHGSFVKAHLGGPTPQEYELLRKEKEELQAKYEELQARYDELSRKVSRSNDAYFSE